MYPRGDHFSSFLRNQLKWMEKWERVRKGIENEKSKQKMTATGYNSQAIKKCAVAPITTPKNPEKEVKRDYILYRPLYRHIADVYHNFFAKKPQMCKEDIEKLYQELKAEDEM